MTVTDNSAEDILDSSSERSSDPLSRKLNKILESRLDTDKDTLDALKALSSFFSENNLRNRRNLRSDIEKRSLQINDEFLQSFRDMKEVLDSLYEDLVAMDQCCNDMMERLKDTKSQTHDLISQTTTLQAEGQKVEMKQQVAESFLATFQLKPEEIKLLRGTREGNLDENFFHCLTKVKKIHNDCKVLLRTSQQTAGIEIMESMALLQESAFERLYRWTQSECRLLNVESPEISPLLCQAMQSLQDRPILFKYSIDEYAGARRTAVVRGFIDALTRGGPGGMPRPIELHSDDPLRYVGDMLAWLHQTSASEKEMLQSLLKQCIGDGLKNDVQKALAHVTEGLCRPLKVRIEQVVVSEPGAVTLFKLCSLLKFYLKTIQQVIIVESQLLQTLEEMHVLCEKMFYNSLTCHTNSILEKVEMPPADLKPPEALKKTLILLKEVLLSQDACLVSVSDRQKDIPQILMTIVDPLLQMCHVAASKLTIADMATFLANCCYEIHSTLTSFEFADHHLELLQSQMDTHLNTLVQEQIRSIIDQVGLGSLYSCLQAYQPKQGPLSSLPECDPIVVQSAVNKLDIFLSLPDSLALPQSSLLLSVFLRQSLRKRSLESFCDVYQQVHEAVNNESNNYSDSEMLLPRTPEHVKTLLLSMYKTAK